MEKAHIRDVLAISKQDNAAGRVSTTSLCGQTDPAMNKLEFARPPAVVDRQLPNFCEKCRKIWLEEQDSLSPEKQALHNFRKQMHVQNNFNRFRQR